tara:strand:- start:102 stop:2258 length:2157 start_codon:yes stop_codon:yes gene_type:complete
MKKDFSLPQYNCELTCFFLNNDKSDVFDRWKYKKFFQNRAVFLRSLLTLVLIFYSVFSIAQVKNYLPNNGLVAWYPFNGNDENVNTNNGVVNMENLTTDWFGDSNSVYSLNGVNCIETKDISAQKIKIIDVNIESKHPNVFWESKENKIVKNKFGKTNLKPLHVDTKSIQQYIDTKYYQQWSGETLYSGHFQYLYKKNKDVEIVFKKDGFLDKSITISSDEIIELKKKNKIVSARYKGKTVNALKLNITINLMPTEGYWIEFKTAFLESCKNSSKEKSPYLSAVKFSKLYRNYFAEDEQNKFFQNVKEYEYAKYDLPSLKKKLKTNDNIIKLDSLTIINLINRREKSIQRSKLLKWNANRGKYLKLYKSFNNIEKEGVNRLDFYGTEGYAIEFNKPVSYLLLDNYKCISFLYSPTNNDLTVNNIRITKSNLQIANTYEDRFVRGKKKGISNRNGFIINNQHLFESREFKYSVKNNTYEKYRPEIINLNKKLEEGEWYYVTIMQTEMSIANSIPRELSIWINGERYLSKRSDLKSKYKRSKSVTFEGGIIDELSISNHFGIDDFKYFLNDEDAIKKIEASYEYYSPNNVAKRKLDSDNIKKSKLAKFDKLPTTEYLSEKRFFLIRNDKYIGKTSSTYMFGYGAKTGSLQFTNNRGQTQFSHFDVVDIIGDKIRIKYTKGLGKGKVESFLLDRRTRHIIMGSSRYFLQQNNSFWNLISNL